MRAALVQKRERLAESFASFGVPNMLFTTREMSYISSPLDCAWRNEFLRGLDVRHICDAYSCVGGDAVQFMLIKPDARVDCVQVADCAETRQRCDRLEHNVLGFSAAAPASRVRVHRKANWVHILSGGCLAVDFLYCDPPWSPHEESSDLISCERMLNLLRYDIALPLEAAKAAPRYVCFKVPFSWEEGRFSQVLGSFPGYARAGSGSFSDGRYWFHVIQRASPSPHHSKFGFIGQPSALT